MKKKIITLALAGLTALSFSTGCFGGDSKDGGIMQTATVMMDAAKAVVKAGKQLADWDTEANKLINQHKERLQQVYNFDYKRYTDAVANFKEKKNDKKNNDAYTKMCQAQKKLLVDMSKDTYLTTNIQKKAGDLAVAYDKIWEDMTKEMGKNLDEESRKAITDAVIKEMTK